MNVDWLNRSMLTGYFLLSTARRSLTFFHGEKACYLGLFPFSIVAIYSVLRKLLSRCSMWSNYHHEGGTWRGLGLLLKDPSAEIYRAVELRTLWLIMFQQGVQLPRRLDHPATTHIVSLVFLSRPSYILLLFRTLNVSLAQTRCMHAFKDLHNVSSNAIICIQPTLT